MHVSERRAIESEVGQRALELTLRRGHRAALGAQERKQTSRLADVRALTDTPATLELHEDLTLLREGRTVHRSLGLARALAVDVLANRRDQVLLHDRSELRLLLRGGLSRAVRLATLTGGSSSLTLSAGLICLFG
jgi:hypothetical protein